MAIVTGAFFQILMVRLLANAKVEDVMQASDDINYQKEKDKKKKDRERKKSLQNTLKRRMAERKSNKNLEPDSYDEEEEEALNPRSFMETQRDTRPEKYD
jgi:hypothetical protein